MPITGIVGKPNVEGVLSTTQPLDYQPKRDFFQIQNVSSNRLYYKLGTGCTASSYHGYIDQGETYINTVYKGPVSIAGTSPSYSIVEY